MKLEKAFEHGEEVAELLEENTFLVKAEAIKILIEAGKEVLRVRAGDPALDGELLPGETEESNEPVSQG